MRTHAIKNIVTGKIWDSGWKDVADITSALDWKRGDAEFFIVQIINAAKFLSVPFNVADYTIVVLKQQYIAE